MESGNSTTSSTRNVVSEQQVQRPSHVLALVPQVTVYFAVTETLKSDGAFFAPQQPNNPYKIEPVKLSAGKGLSYREAMASQVCLSKVPRLLGRAKDGVFLLAAWGCVAGETSQM